MLVSGGRPSIGIIGGGISGLAVAQRLEQHGFTDNVLYDTGARGVGGRASSRLWEGGGGPLPVDHVAQFFTTANEAFRKAVDEWCEAGVVQEWSSDVLGSIDLDAGGVFTSFEEAEKKDAAGGEAATPSPARWIGTRAHGGIGGVALHMARSLQHTGVQQGE